MYGTYSFLHLLSFTLHSKLSSWFYRFRLQDDFFAEDAKKPNPMLLHQRIALQL